VPIRHERPDSETLEAVLSTARYRPRDFATDPDAFGKGTKLQWVPKPTYDDETTWAELTREQFEQRTQLERWTRGAVHKEASRWGAAQIQHNFALAIRTAIKAKGWTVKRYAQEVGAEYDRISRILRGTVVMTFDDVIAADQTLGGIYPPPTITRPKSS